MRVFHWSLSDSKSLEAYKTLLNILANRNNSAVWMVSIFPLISNSSSLFPKALCTVPSAPTTIGIIGTLLFFFFNSLAMSKYLSISLFSLILTLWSVGTVKSTRRQSSFFLVNQHKVWSSGWDKMIRLYSKSLGILCVSFSRTYSGLPFGNIVKF